MEVLFVNEKAKRLFSDSRALQKTWGTEGAKKIVLRLQQLGAAETLEDMRALPGRCHELTGDRAGTFAVDLHGGFRLIFASTADPPPLKPDGGLEWRTIDSVTVLEVKDYH